MSWNYRVMRHIEPVSSDEIEYWFQVHEVFYDKDGVVVHWTNSEVSIGGEDLDALARDMGRMKRALSLAVLDYKTGKEVLTLGPEL